MPSTTEITVQQLSRLIGLPAAPAIVDVRTDEDYANDPRLFRARAGATSTLSRPGPATIATAASSLHASAASS